MTTRKVEIDLYLIEIKDSIDYLKAKYKNGDLDNKPAIDVLKVLACIVGLRACLDYLYNDVIDIIIIQSNAANPDPAITKELKQDQYFRYGKINQADFDSYLIIKRLKTDNLPIYTLLESCQLHKFDGRKIEALCKFSNQIKHDDTGQEKVNVKKISIEKELASEEGWSYFYTGNLQLYGNSENGLHTNVLGKKIAYSKNITLIGLRIPKIEIFKSTNIKIIDCIFENLTSVNSSVEIIRCKIAGKDQRDEILINYDNITTQPLDLQSINGGELKSSYPSDNFNISSINEVHFLIKNTDLLILDLISQTFTKVQLMTDEFYKHLPTN
jgi:hypothetical protein